MKTKQDKFNLDNFNLKLYNEILDRGLSSGVGERSGSMCIEAAICTVLGLPHGDDPGCVAESVRSFKIALNDCNWSSPGARSRGLRELGIAQLGSLGVVKNEDFKQKLQEKTIRVLLPKLFRLVFPKNEECLKAAEECEKLGTKGAAAWAAATSARAAAWAAPAAEAAARAAAWAEAPAAAEAAARAATVAAEAAWAAGAARATAAAWAARVAAGACREAAWAAGDEFLILSAHLALETLKELKSPGCKLLK